MNPLGPPDAFHLSAAQGWLELGNHVEADKELDKIVPSLRAHPDVLEVRWKVYARARKWETCVEIASVAVAVDAGRPEGWINRSYALHELKRTQEALDLLEPAAELFSDQWLVRYNLACYSCQLGNREKAWEWLKNAFDLAGDRNAVKKMALQDKDLEPLWAEIGEA